MEIAGVVERVERISAVRSNPSATADLVEAGMVAVREVQAWCDAQHAGLVTQLRGVDSFPERRIAKASKTSLGKASKTTERAATLGATPALADALGDGAITGGHVDAVTRAARQLDANQRGELLERADALAEVAKAGTVEEFSDRLALETKRLQEDDGIDRLERQRRNARARSWVDQDGMFNLSGKFDPLTGVRIAARIDAMVQTMFGDAVPDGCPEDPIEKQRYLAAQALARLLLDEALADTSPPEAGATSGPGGADTRHGTGTGAAPTFDGSAGPGPVPNPPPPRPRAGRPEFVVVIDADAPDQTGPVCEFAIPVEIPARVLATLAGDADLQAVVVRNGVVLYAPGELNLGRSTRLANRAQRRALRGVYRSCAIPGCGVSYDRCKLHHIIWWRHGGHTDLDNLIPVCSVHHSRIHNDNWTIELGPNRELTLTLPDGTTHTTGPPRRSNRRQPAA
jgi:hypothetical protein